MQGALTPPCCSCVQLGDSLLGRGKGKALLMQHSATFGAAADGAVQSSSGCGCDLCTYLCVMCELQCSPSRPKPAAQV